MPIFAVIMKLLLAIVFATHGFAHLVGFVVPWKIAAMEEMPYKTSILKGKLNLGNNGIRIYGLFWLLLALAFFAIASALLLHQDWWLSISLYVAMVSLFFCILGWPDARIGIAINLLIIFLIPNAIRLGWITI